MLQLYNKLLWKFHTHLKFLKTALQMTSFTKLWVSQKLTNQNELESFVGHRIYYVYCIPGYLCLKIKLIRHNMINGMEIPCNRIRLLTFTKRVSKTLNWWSNFGNGMLLGRDPIYSCYCFTFELNLTLETYKCTYTGSKFLWYSLAVVHNCC